MEEDTQAVLLVGLTGSGKTPLGELLQCKGLWQRQCCHFDFGWNLRRAVEGTGSPGCLTRKETDFLRGVLRSGALLENEHFGIAEKVLRTFVEEHKADKDTFLILNGLPRHIGQACSLHKLHIDVKAVIELSCTPEAAFKRIGMNAGGDRTGRTDDDIKSIRGKLEVFARQTVPLLDYYRRLGVRIETVDVDVSTAAEDIWQMLDARACFPEK